MIHQYHFGEGLLCRGVLFLLYIFLLYLLVRRRKKKIPIITDLDLHGIKHRDVEIIVEDYILMHKPPFKIITGHSNIMKDLTKTILDKHEYKYQDGVLNNLGCILVTSE
jgi:hypothetical protein